MLEIERQAFLSTDRFTRRQLSSALRSPNARTFVCRHRGACIGYVTGFVTRLRNGLFKGRVYSIAVLPPWQRRSAGSELLRAIESWFRRRGVAFVTLETRTDRHGARPFFLGHGYEEVGVLRGYYITSNGMRMKKRTRPPRARSRHREDEAPEIGPA